MCSFTDLVCASSFFVRLLTYRCHARPHVGIGDRGDGALVFLHLGHDFGGERHRDAGQLFPGDIADTTLVRVVCE